MSLHPQSGWPQEAPQGGLVSERLFHWLWLTHCPAAEHRRTGPIRHANCLTRPRRGVFARPARSRSAGQFEGPRDRAPFLLVRFLWASKENEQLIILPGSVESLRVLEGLGKKPNPKNSAQGPQTVKKPSGDMVMPSLGWSLPGNLTDKGHDFLSADDIPYIFSHHIAKHFVRVRAPQVFNDAPGNKKW